MVDVGERTGRAGSAVSPRAHPDWKESGCALDLLRWSHFLRRTGTHVAGKCSSSKTPLNGDPKRNEIAAGTGAAQGFDHVFRIALAHFNLAHSLPNGGKPMARVRCITEMGMGVDVHGRDATKAARRAVSDAIRHSSLGFVRMLGKTPHDMLVDVTIGAPNPDAVDISAVAKELPYGTVTVKAIKGGLEIPAEGGGDAITIANAAVIVSLDDGK